MSLPAPASPTESLQSPHVGAVHAALQASHSPATLRAYAGAFRRFADWMARAYGMGFELPADPLHVAAYLAGRASRVGIASERMDAAAIRATAALPRTGPTGRTESAETAIRRAVMDTALAATVRDAMLRRSEAAALRWADVEFRADGSARVSIRRSKTDQTGAGAVQYLGPQATRSLRALKRMQDAPGPDARVFGVRSGRAISNRLAAMGRAAGLDGISGHAGRVGMARDLVAAGASVSAVQVAGRWKSARMPAHYARAELAGRGAVAAYYGL